MAKPRVFISSTFYDLRQIRSDLDNFIDTLGYEAEARIPRSVEFLSRSFGQEHKEEK